MLENKTLKNRIQDFTNLVKKYQAQITENCKQKEIIRIQNDIIKDFEKENELLKKALKGG